MQQVSNRKGRNEQANITREELARYAACVFQPYDIVEVRRLPSGRSSWYKASELLEVAKSLLNDNQQKEHIYIGANPRCVRGGTRSKDVVYARCLFVDFDGISYETARDRWHKAGIPPPTLTITSGHGIHAYWRLKETIKDMGLWSNLQKRLICLLNSDNAIHDPPRIMRLPGFINHKQPVAKCRIIDDENTRIYDLGQIIALMYSGIIESDYTVQYMSIGNYNKQLKKQFYNKLQAFHTEKITSAKWPGVNKGSRNCKAFQHAAFLVKDLALREEKAWPILREWNLKNRPPLSEWELRMALRNAHIYGRHRADDKAAG